MRPAKAGTPFCNGFVQPERKRDRTGELQEASKISRAAELRENRSVIGHESVAVYTQAAGGGEPDVTEPMWEHGVERVWPSCDLWSLPAARGRSAPVRRSCPSLLPATPVPPPPAAAADSSLPIAMAISGASGSRYAVRLLEVLLEAGREVHLTISPAAEQVFKAEVGMAVAIKNFRLDSLLPHVDDARLHYWHHRDFGAGIASGSFRTGGMVVCPCSMGTLAAIAQGLSQNLLHRAADVHLKERRPLVLVPRETPLGVVQLRNMTTAAEAGAIVLPAMPGFYHDPHTIDDLVDFIVQRICDQLGVDVTLTQRWSEPA